ncbi:hypothetical protein BGX34_010113 [Mortierella sp. NVP85]|nr:hypothetical protein BGX34_010113 [Mortierella sp. NVP85]
MTKGRILNHAGGYVQASHALREARKLAKQGRYINSKCTKYLLREHFVDITEDQYDLRLYCLRKMTPGLKESKKAEEQKAQADQEILKKDGKIDEDLGGLKYTNTTDPLGETLKSLKPLQQLAAERIDTHLMGFEIYIRKTKFPSRLRMDVEH